MNAHPKPLPPLTSDAEAENFVETADLSEYDLSGFTPMRFEIEPKAASSMAWPWVAPAARLMFSFSSVPPRSLHPAWSSCRAPVTPTFTHDSWMLGMWRA